MSTAILAAASAPSTLDVIHDALVSPLGAALATGTGVFVVALLVILVVTRRRAPAVMVQVSEPARPASYYPPNAFPYAEVQVPPYMPPPEVPAMGDSLRPRDVLVIPPYSVEPRASEPPTNELPPIERTQPLPILRPNALPNLEGPTGLMTAIPAPALAPAPAPALAPAPAPALAPAPAPAPAFALAPAPAPAPATLPPPPPARITRRPSSPIFAALAPLPEPAPAPAPVVVAAPAIRPPSTSDVMELSELDFEDDSPTEFIEPHFELQELSAGGARHAGIPKIRRVAPEPSRAASHASEDGSVLPLVRQGNRRVPAAS